MCIICDSLQIVPESYNCDCDPVVVNCSTVTMLAVKCYTAPPMKTFFFLSSFNAFNELTQLY